MKTKNKIVIIIALTSVVLVSALVGTLLYLNSPKEDHLSFVKHDIDTNFSQITYITNTDLNGDDNQDILACAYLGNDIAWWEYSDGNFTKHTIETDFPRVIHVHPEDLDKDGDMDILGTSETSDQLAWWENNGGNFTKRIITTTYTSPNRINCIDFDRDNDLDILSTSDYEVTWWENDGELNFTRHSISSDLTSTYQEHHHFIYAIDFNNDDIMDIITGGASVSYGGLFCWRNEGNGTFIKIRITQNYNRVHEIRVADIDKDGDVDICCSSTSSNVLNWFENTENFNFVKHTIKEDFYGAAAGFPIDLDKDGDIDVVGTAYYGDKLSWFENVGSDNFIEHTISENLDLATSSCAFDVDNDSDIDIFTGAGDEIAFWENV